MGRAARESLTSRMSALVCRGARLEKLSRALSYTEVFRLIWLTWSLFLGSRRSVFLESIAWDVGDPIDHFETDPSAVHKAENLSSSVDIGTSFVNAKVTAQELDLVLHLEGTERWSVSTRTSRLSSSAASRSSASSSPMSRSPAVPRLSACKGTVVEGAWRPLARKFAPGERLQGIEEILTPGREHGPDEGLFVGLHPIRSTLWQTRCSTLVLRRGCPLPCDPGLLPDAPPSVQSRPTPTMSRTLSARRPPVGEPSGGRARAVGCRGFRRSRGSRRCGHATLPHRRQGEWPLAVEDSRPVVRSRPGLGA
jgi:hypothetical protein